MTDHEDARQLLADITAGLEGVTPGPWRSYEHPWGATNVTTARNSSLDEDIIASCHVKQDGDHFRRCDPETMQTIDREFTALTLELAAASQRIAELEAERQWQPIETAPRDGTIILGKGGIYHGVPFPVKWAPSQYRPDYPWECVVSRSNFYDHCLSHWMHLPASPHEGTQ